MCPSSKVHSTRRFVFDTSYDFTLNEILGGSGSATDRNDGSTSSNSYVSSCVKDRGQTGLQTFYMSNHYANNALTKLPSESNANVLNTYDVIQARHEVCKDAFGGKKVNILMVDFWSLHGEDILNYVDNENIQRYNEKFGITPDDRGGGSDWTTNTNDDNGNNDKDPFFGEYDGRSGSSTTSTTTEATESLPSINGTGVPSLSPAPIGNSTTSPTTINTTNIGKDNNDGGGDNNWIDSTTEAMNGLQLGEGGGRGNHSSAYTIIVAGCIAIGGILLIVLYACCKQRQSRRYKQDHQQGRRQQQCRPMSSSASARPPSSSLQHHNGSGGTTTTATAKKCPSSLSTAYSLSFGGEE